MKTCITHSFACDCREEKFKQLEAENAALKSRIEKLREALEFYASEGFWGEGYSNDYGRNPMMLNNSDHDYEVIGDDGELIGGKTARAALKEDDLKST